MLMGMLGDKRAYLIHMSYALIAARQGFAAVAESDRLAVLPAEALGALAHFEIFGGNGGGSRGDGRFGNLFIFDHQLESRKSGKRFSVQDYIEVLIFDGFDHYFQQRGYNFFISGWIGMDSFRLKPVIVIGKVAIECFLFMRRVGSLVNP